MNKTLRALKARQAAHIKAMRAITDKATAENRELTAEEQAAFDTEKKALEAVKVAVTREEALIAEEQQLGELDVPGARRIEIHERVEDDPRRGFASMGDFLQALVHAGTNFTNPGDERLRPLAAAPTTFGSELSGIDGGFSVPPEFGTEIFTLSLTEDSLLPYTDDYTIGGNSMVFPKDETTPWGTDGIRAYWQAEAAAATQTKPKLGTATLRMKKLMALVPITDELLADTNALGQYIPAKVAASIRWKTNEAILFGTGAGTPEGALVGAAALTVAKDSGQATLTVSTTNLTNMLARLPPGSYQRAVWLINNDVLGPLFALTLGNYPVYLPTANPQQGGISMNPYAVGTLLGRPALISQHANTFSSIGDVQLHDLSYYWTITKANGISTATSMHLYFDADATAFRTIFRVDGQPKIAAQISPAKGSNKMSPFLQLQAR